MQVSVAVHWSVAMQWYAAMQWSVAVQTTLSLRTFGVAGVSLLGLNPTTCGK